MKVTIDHRERSSGLVERLAGYFEVEVRHLPCGDYLLNNRILVERKTARDLLLSVIDTRLFRQVRRLKDAEFKTVLLIEGDPFQTDLDFPPEAIRGTLLSLKAIWQLPVIFSSSKEETRDILVTLGKQDMKNVDVALLRSGYRPRRLKTRQLYLLQGLPNIGPILAKRLLDHFGTPIGTLSGSIEELSTVKGIGAEKARIIRELLDNQHATSKTISNIKSKADCPPNINHFGRR